MTSSPPDDGPSGQRVPSHSLTPPPMSPLTPANNELNDDLANQTLQLAEQSNRAASGRLGEPSLGTLPITENNLTTPTHGGNGMGASLRAGAAGLHAPFGNATMDLYDQRPIQTPMTPQNLMMALARISASQMALPPTVAPAQVSMSPALHQPGDSLLHGNGHVHGIPAIDNPLESFARIEFADSVFQMTTYSVIIGRDQRALEQARRDERRTEQYQRRVEENAAQGLPPPSPPSQDRGKFSKSYVSEEGGMLGPESDGDDPRPAKRRKTSGAGSASGTSQHEIPMDEPIAPEVGDKNLISNRQYVSHTPGAAAVDLASLRPSPHHVSFIGIHSPGPNIASRTKAISREHMKINFNPDKGVFEAIPLHKNGFFCEDVHYKDTNVILRSGDRLQVKDVEFVFVINGVPRRKTGAEDYLDEEEAPQRRYSEGGKEMSFEFESSHAGEILSSPSAEAQEDSEMRADKDDSGSELSEPGEDMDGDMENDVMETIEGDGDEDGPIKNEPEQETHYDLPPMPPKKRGPGRPPKNGIMSKREERLRKKMALEAAKKNMPPPPLGEPPVKRKVGRPRKHPLPENAGDKPEKRKYKPRKPKNEDGEEGSGAEKTVKEKRREKPKTPPLELRREDYSEDQLQKPNKNYGVLIDEVLSAAPDGLTLKQIYKRIQMKYPFYYFTVDTKGWESSVRHNLIGNDAFKKNEETHLWSRVPGIDIDAGKKRKAQSPDHSAALHHGYGAHHPHHQSHMGHAMYQGAHAPAPGYPAAAGQHAAYPQHNLSQAHAGHAQQNFAPQGAGPHSQQPSPRPPAYPVQPQAGPAVGQTAAQAPTQNPATPGPAPGYGAPAAARPAQAGAQPGAYSSPYAKQPPQAVPPARPSPHALPAQPGQAQIPATLPNGLPRVATPSSQTSPMPLAPQPAGAPRVASAAPSNGNAAPALRPPIPPEHVKHIISFKKLVTEQLASRTNSPSAPLAIAMSVINRGLDLTTQSVVEQEHQNLEKIVLGVFDTTRKNQNLRIEPGLLKVLTDFKGQWTKTLSGKLGQPKTEALLLSTIDRVLGISDVSTMRGSEAEMKEYEGAETMLMNPLRKAILDHQQRAATAAPAGA
ncbi:hypothetical protein GQ53DRAFT_848124 [Thozetella sp. PMI_491]|nr:hypothetical protein GQ53DRAFT_848124 [Thozetella sp. PMI_491]